MTSRRTMPTGVQDPAHVAQAIAADLGRTRAGRQRPAKKPGVGRRPDERSPVPADLERLLEAVRAGDPEAIEQLKQQFRAFIIRGDGSSGRP